MYQDSEKIIFPIDPQITAKAIRLKRGDILQIIRNKRIMILCSEKRKMGETASNCANRVKTSTYNIGALNAVKKQMDPIGFRSLLSGQERTKVMHFRRYKWAVKRSAELQQQINELEVLRLAHDTGVRRVGLPS